MNRILAIAHLTLRDAVRSRLVLYLIVILSALICGLASTVKGDGTLTGQLRVFVGYSLGLTTILLGIVTLWTACGSIAREVRDKQIQLVVVKPVHRFEIWIGKWLGILTMNAGLLTMAGLLVYTSAHWQLRRSSNDSDAVTAAKAKVLAGRRLLIPQVDDVHEETHRVLSDLIATGQISADAPSDDSFEAITRRIRAKRQVVSPGRTRKWIFSVPDSVVKRLHNEMANIEASVRFSSSVGSINSVTARWVLKPIGADSHRALSDVESFSFDLTDAIDGTHTFQIPSSAIPENGQFSLEFINGGRNESATVIFKQDGGLRLLAPESGFGSNLLRALIIVLCQLAALAAVGLTTGSLFFLPAATFTAHALLLIALISHFFIVSSLAPQRQCSHQHHSAGESAPMIERAAEHMIVLAGGIVEPAMQFAPLEMVAEGVLVTWSSVARAILILGVVYCAAFGLISGLALNRRELALPM